MTFKCSGFWDLPQDCRNPFRRIRLHGVPSGNPLFHRHRFHVKEDNYIDSGKQVDQIVRRGRDRNRQDSRSRKKASVRSQASRAAASS